MRLLFPWNDRITQAHTLDLSGTGMRVETHANLVIGTKLVIHFAPVGENVTQRVEGQVMWVRPPTPDRNMYTCGFHFVNMSNEARVSLDKILASQPPPGEVAEVSDADIVESDEPQHFAAQLSSAVVADQGRHAERRREAEALGREATNAAAAGALTKATKLLEQALQLAPESRELTEELARVLYLRGEVARAAELFDRALRLQHEQS